jgi:hypothetical protein
MSRATAVTDKRQSNPVFTWKPSLNMVSSKFTIRCFQRDIRQVSISEKPVSPLYPISGIESPGKMRTLGMIITTRNGKSYDTDRDLTAPERHILQKLIIWESFAASIDQFREKEKEAMLRGWNNSGPIKTSQTMIAILVELEEKVLLRLGKEMKII